MLWAVLDNEAFFYLATCTGGSINASQLPHHPNRTPAIGDPMPTPAATVEASRSSSRSMSSVCGAVNRTTSPPNLNIHHCQHRQIYQMAAVLIAGITNSKPVFTSSSTASLGLAVGYSTEAIPPVGV